MGRLIKIAWDYIIPAAIGVTSGAVVIILYVASSRNKVEVPAGYRKVYHVETFTPDLMVRIECSGNCNLLALIREAKEAVKR